MALLRNQATALLRHERINTTLAKAKELRPFVERLITVAKRGLADGPETGRALHARRLVGRDVADREVAKKLFDAIAPRFAERPGGYTRLFRVGRRQGDDAPLAQVELVGSEYTPDSGSSDDAKAAAPVKAKGVGSRIRQAAKRITGGETAAEADTGADATEAKPARRTRKKKSD